MRKHKLFLIFPFIAFIAFILGSYAIGQNPQKEKENDVDHKGGELPNGYNDLFAGSGECLLCHNSHLNSQGESVSIIADWRSSMKANAARDPLWQAKMSHEGLVNPTHKEALEDVCTRCHAPTGNHNAHHNGQSYYSGDDMRADPLAMDGVQCTVCHQIKESSLGTFSGQIDVGTEKKIWGPYENPFGNPMINNTGYTPTHGQHINDAKLCGSCHTLLTNSVDLNGIPTGTQFVEQAIYQEWENSDFSVSATTCQDCHVPRIDDPVKISTMPPWLDPRTPFGMHQFAGANVFMSRLLKDFGGQIGVTASQIQYDSTIARSTRMLQNQTLDIILTEESRIDDTLSISLLLQNMAGHKFPGGYPSRRAFIEVIAHSDANDTLFHSGRTDEDFNLIGEDSDFESHHKIINSQDQVQIYEMVMGNVNGEVTTVLEQAFMHLKDNRIPPVGFTTSHYSYDTVQIVGNAVDDGNFNHNSGNEGSGSDRIEFHIPIQGFGGTITVSARVHYQTINDKWLEQMFEYSSTEIDAFKSYYDNAEKTPVLVASQSITSAALHLEENPIDNLTIYPNPVKNKLNIKLGNQELKQISVYKLNGELLAITAVSNNDWSYTLDVSEHKGILILKINNVKGKEFVRKVLVQ